MPSPNSQGGFQPRNTPAERRAFFDVQRQFTELNDCCATVKTRLDDYETRLIAVEEGLAALTPPDLEVVATFGYNVIGSGAVPSADWYGVDAHHASSGRTYTAVAGDVVTAVYFYGASPTSAGTEIAVYATSGATITTRTGSPVAVALTPTPGWGSATCSIPLVAGTTYTLAFDFWIGATITAYRNTGLGGLRRSDSTDSSLGATWNETSTTSGESFSFYAEVSR